LALLSRHQNTCLCRLSAYLCVCVTTTAKQDGAKVLAGVTMTTSNVETQQRYASLVVQLHWQALPEVNIETLSGAYVFLRILVFKYSTSKEFLLLDRISGSENAYMGDPRSSILQKVCFKSRPLGSKSKCLTVYNSPSCTPSKTSV
jgi:hypothetical protein